MKQLLKSKNWFLKMKRRARGSAPAVFAFNPTCESLERRELLASTILFNPTGSNATQPITIGALDLAPGNTLAVNSLPLTVGNTFQLDYQATLAGVIDPNGGSISPPGLNTTYQITAVASITEVVTQPDSERDRGDLRAGAHAVAEQLLRDLLQSGRGRQQPGGDRLQCRHPDTHSQSGPHPDELRQLRPRNRRGRDSGHPPFDQFEPNNYPGIQTVTGVGSALSNVRMSLRSIPHSS